MPAGVVTDTAPAPGPPVGDGGTVTCTTVSDTTVNAPAATPSTVTAPAAVNPDPTTVTDVPPPTGPERGQIAVTERPLPPASAAPAGAASHRRAQPDREDHTDPERAHPPPMVHPTDRTTGARPQSRLIQCDYACGRETSRGGRDRPETFLRAWR